MTITRTAQEAGRGTTMLAGDETIFSDNRPQFFCRVSVHPFVRQYQNISSSKQSSLGPPRLHRPTDTLIQAPGVVTNGTGWRYAFRGHYLLEA